MQQLRAVIFDMDGVLVDSEQLHIVAWRELFARKGITVSPEDFHNAIGQSDVSFLTQLFARRGREEDVMAWLLAKKAIFNRLLHERGKLFPGVRDLVARMHGRYRLGVASSSWRESVSIALSIFGLMPLFDDFVGKDDVTEQKPDPEAYLLAARRLEVSPGNCAAIEDSQYGIDAALAAGMHCVAVAHTLPPAELRRAHLVVPSLVEAAPIEEFLDSRP